MAVISLEERVAALESEVARLKEQLTAEKPPALAPWWERIYGTFGGSSEYEEAMRLGRAYRESLCPSNLTDFHKVPGLSVEDWSI